MNAEDLRNIRLNLGLTQKELAEKVGVDIKTIQNWEYGKKIPSTKDGIIRALVESINNVDQQNVNGDNIKSGGVEFMEIIREQQRSLQKAQEQIDRLITLLENK